MDILHAQISLICCTSYFDVFSFILSDARTFSFKTTQFGTMCLLQDTHINMPFQSWELRPHKLDSAVLTIIAAIVEIEIEIKVSRETC